MTEDPTSLLYGEDVLADLIAYRRSGRRACLASLVGIDGATLRPLGAEMAIDADGRFTGYLSSGCLEQTVALEARRLIASGENRLVRFGKGSTYFDLKLPCGSGLDVYFDQALSDGTLAEAARHRAARQPFTIETNLDTGESRLVKATGAALLRFRRDGSLCCRTYLPAPRVLAAGAGPMFTGIVRLLAAAGLPLAVATPEDDARDALAVSGIAASGLRFAEELDTTHLDRYAAAIIAFHEHDWEAPVIARILERDAFYIGVLGSRTAHANRIARLRELGVAEASIARLHAPIGTIPGARGRLTLAAGVLAELVTHARTTGLLA